MIRKLSSGEYRLVLTKGQSTNRPAAEPWDVQVARGRGTSRTGGSVLQAPRIATDQRLLFRARPLLQLVLSLERRRYRRAGFGIDELHWTPA